MDQPRTIRIRRTRHVPRSLVRRIAGWLVIFLGLLGLVLPILPGLVLLAIGILILGPHDPGLRRIAITLRIILRRWSQMKQPHLRRIGQLARRWYGINRMAIRAHLHNHEHGNQGWRAHLLLLGVTLVGMAITTTTIYVIWHTIP